MKPEIQSLHKVWSAHRARQQINPGQQISFDQLTNSIVSTGPFYFYIIDFYDMSVSHVSAPISDLQGFDPENTSLNEIVKAIHPEDIGFVVKAEDFIIRFFLEKLGFEKLPKYKMSYNFRARLKNGEYVLFNHQALVLTIDENWAYGKSLNIHTRIDHLSTVPNHKISLIGLHGEPSYMNLSIDEKPRLSVSYSKREIDILKNVAEGLDSAEIAEKLFIAEATVKKHRKNILRKSDSKNMIQLIKTCVLQGLI